MEHEAAIKLAEELAISHQCDITLEDIAPVYVPKDYQKVMTAENQMVKEFPNGSRVTLNLLPF